MVIRKVFETIIPNVEVGPEKGLSMDAIRALLNIPASGHVTNEPAAEYASRMSPYHSPLGPATQIEASIFGAARHSAVLLGMTGPTHKSNSPNAVRTDRGKRPRPLRL